ncbi:hypothetical protein FS842_005635 [Serendipita sp. 407]|nr:hypothetical protein FS842_005635 [Serendipita sp. 407]
MFAVTDAGGSTVDSTLYECKSVNPLVLEEVCESECVQAGGVFIDRALQGILEDKLRESEFGDPDSVTEMVRSFERKASGTRVFLCPTMTQPRPNGYLTIPKHYVSLTLVVRGIMTVATTSSRARSLSPTPRSA